MRWRWKKGQFDATGGEHAPFSLPSRALNAYPMNTHRDFLDQLRMCFANAAVTASRKCPPEFLSALCGRGNLLGSFLRGASRGAGLLRAACLQVSLLRQRACAFAGKIRSAAIASLHMQRITCCFSRGADLPALVVDDSAASAAGVSSRMLRPADRLGGVSVLLVDNPGKLLWQPCGAPPSLPHPSVNPINTRASGRPVPPSPSPFFFRSRRPLPTPPCVTLDLSGRVRAGVPHERRFWRWRRRRQFAELGLHVRRCDARGVRCPRRGATPGGKNTHLFLVFGSKRRSPFESSRLYRYLGGILRSFVLLGVLLSQSSRFAQPSSC